VLSLDHPEVYRSVLEGVAIGVYIVDRDCRVVFWNDAAERITGYLRLEVLGRSRQSEIFEPGGGQAVLGQASFAHQQAMREGNPQDATVLLRHKAGHRILVEVRAFPVRNAEGDIIGAAETFNERGLLPGGQRREDRLAAAGSLSDLTGLPNREYMISALSEHLAVFGSHQVQFGVLCFEIHDLQKFRATYGRVATGSILKVVARTIQNSLSPVDVVGHWTESQFLALLPDCGAGIGKVGDRVSQIVGRAGIQWWGDQLSATVTWAGTLVQSGDTLEVLTGRLERALSLGEATGGNCLALQPTAHRPIPVRR
jgi:PAS domain S-box-containing protein